MADGERCDDEQLEREHAEYDAIQLHFDAREL